MREATKSNALLFFLFLAVIFMEVIFKYKTVLISSFYEFLLSVIFILFYLLLAYFIITFLQGRWKFILSVLLLSGASFIYSSQLIYYQFFKTFYSLYSIKNGLQVIDFWQDIVSYLFKNIFWVLLIFLPTIVFLLFGYQYFSFLKTRLSHQLILSLSILFLYVTGIGMIHVGGDELHSPYDLYYHNSYPQRSVERLGLLTTMRLDLQRFITNWSPQIGDAPTVSLDAKYTEPEGKIDFQPSNSGSDVDEEKDGEENEQVQEKVKYNVIDFNFDELIKNESDPEIRKLHEYFAAKKPTAQNEYTGKYEGYNLILLTAESFAPYAVHQEVTPTLYKLIHEGYRFTNFYTPIWQVSTSDGEYVALQSLIPKSGVWSFQESGQNFLPFVLGNQLKERGYTTKGYHNHTYTYYGRHISHPNLGYDYKGLGNGLDVEETWPESDLEMMEKTVEEYIQEEPFHTYYMTVSGHMQYSFTGNYIAWKNKKHVDHLPYSDQAKAYIATHVELDRALEYLLRKLEEHDVLDRTLIALSSDHYPYGLKDETINELVGHTVEENFELYKNEFILYAEDMEPKVIDKQASSLDILPTLSNLMGLSYDSRMMMGKDIFSDSEPIVPFLNKSFITERGKYNSETKQFKSFDGSSVNEAYIDYISKIVQQKFYYSTKILETDYYRSLFVE